MKNNTFINLRVCVLLLLIGLIELSNELLTDSNRPKFRNDYRYEKAFDTFYKLHLEGVSWYNSRIRCEAEGTELMVPENLDEADSIPLLVAPILNKHQGAYVGMHDLYSERTFVTINGSTLRDTLLELLWELTQPEHSGGRCVATRRNGRLFVNPCSNPMPFLCKIKASNVVYHKECDTFHSSWKLGPNATCYIVHIEPQTWFEAFSTCFSAGGYLAVINSKEEAEYIRDMFKKVELSRTPSDFAFIGFSDLLQKYHYRTVLGDHLDKQYVNWDFKCSQNDTESDERCGGFRRSGLISTGNCNVPAMFFCEKPATGAFSIKSLMRQEMSAAEWIVKILAGIVVYTGKGLWILAKLGFVATGVVAGSVAAAAMSVTGNVQSGSIISRATSMAMRA